MSNLLRSALGYFNDPSAAGPGGVGSQPGNQSRHGGGGAVGIPSGFQGDETTSIVGTVINFEVSGQQRGVRIQKLIAEGGFSYVYKGVDGRTGELIAVKKMLAPDPDAAKVVEQEIEFMKQFQHDNIIKFYGSLIRPSGRLKEYFISMEFCPVQLPSLPLKIQHTTQVFGQTCKAIKYLHDFGIVHRDIKLENILIGFDGLVKLVDFGSATMDKIYPTADWSMSKRTLIEEQIAQQTTPMYRAPEMLDLWSNYPIDEHSDLWALGCLLFTLNFGQHPFQDSNKLAITNANYSLPKNCSDANPIVCIIRGLLKVNPTDRMTFGQIFELLQSIAECNGFTINEKLPFKPAESPTLTNSLQEDAGGNAPPTQHQPQSQQHAQGGAGSGSLFSSIKGVGSNLLKNIKEQSQQYMYGNGSNVPPGSQGVRPTSRIPSQNQPGSNVPPARPAPPSPRQPAKSHIEFENREYEMMQQQHRPPPRPAPPKPPLPATTSDPEPVQERVGNLLDISLDDSSESHQLPGSSAQPVATTMNNNLLDDLFGSSSSTTTVPPQASVPSFADDLMWGDNKIGVGASDNKSTPPFATNVPQKSSDPFASLEQSLPTKPVTQTGFMQPQQASFGGQGAFGVSNTATLIQPVGNIPSSASFQNLSYQKNQTQSRQTGGMDLLGGNLGSSTSNKTSSGMPKNSSTPNLLSDLLLGDIMGATSQMNISPDKQPTSASAANSINKSNPSIHQMGNGNGSQMKPNYNRHQIFDPPPANPTEKKQTLNDAFGDILTSQGFSSAKGGNQTRTMNDLRKIDMLQNQNIDPVQLKVNDWREGKKKNIRALLASLHTVTWEGCNWEETNMSQMITPAQVKKTYRKACLAIHPDKQMGKDWEQLAKLLFVELNEAWAAFEETQQT